MKFKILLPLAAMLTFLLAALSTGSPLLLLLAVMLLLTILGGGLSVLWAAATLSVSGNLNTDSVHRGDEVRLMLQVRHRGLFPIAPVMLEIVSDPAQPARVIYLRDKPGKLQSLTMPFHADHVGRFTPGVRSWQVEDLMGFFQYRHVVNDSCFQLLVLPNLFLTKPLTLSPGDPGSDIMARATEDLSAPSDIRSYQVGDPMKKIHWKLSLRKQELLVRKFDEPILQEVLILMDCSRPPSWGHPEAEADIRDALLETSASVFADQQKTDLAVHFPLFGNHPMELEKNMGLPLVLESLSLLDFSETDRFERVLMLESRRLRKVGCLVVVSARLNSDMVDVMIRMHHLGPSLRLYLITYNEDDPNLLALVSRVRQDGIELTFIQPDHVAFPQQ